MSTEETQVQTENDRAWTSPLPTEPTKSLKTGSDQRLQEQRPQPRKARRARAYTVIATVLWTAFAAAIYLLFTA